MSLRDRKRYIVWILIATALTLTAVGFLRYRSPRYIFVDGGSHLGETVQHFKKSPLYNQHTWEIYAFEANPNLIPSFRARSKDVTLLNQALWNKDGSIEFYLAENTLGSSVLKDKKTGHLSKVPVRVESIDFGQWLKRKFNRKDQILVKLDIEGAEYEVLDKMLADGTIGMVDKLYVEFHNVKVNVPVTKDQRILSQLQKRNILVDASGSVIPGDWFGKGFPASQDTHKH